MIKRLSCNLALIAMAVMPAMAGAGTLIISGTPVDAAEPSRLVASVASGHAPVISVVPALPLAVGQATLAGMYSVVATDKTIREVLQRWARSSGWTHDQVHWALQRDYPVQGTATADNFPGDFKMAARALLSSTQTTDLPAQPCFYTNLIIRVVPQAELCDRTSTSRQ